MGFAHPTCSVDPRRLLADELTERAALALEAAADGKARTASDAAAALEALATAPIGSGLRSGTLHMAYAIRTLVWPGLRFTRDVVYPALARELRAMQFCETIGRGDQA